MTTEWLNSLELALTQAAGVLLALGAAAALLIGLGLLLAPARALTFLHLDDAQGAAWFWERYFYRRHRVFGGLIVLGALYVVVRLLTLGSPGNVATALGFATANGVGVILIQTGWALLLLGSLLALPFGAIVFVRPSLLKGIERQANRPLTSAEGYVLPIRRPRCWGLFFIIGALYTVGSLGLAMMA